MSRLPTPGADDGQWGTILNDFLSQSLDANGKLLSGSVGSAQLQNNSVSNAALDSNLQTAIANARNATKLQGTDVDTSTPNNGQALMYQSSSSSWVPATITSSGSVADATTSGKGIVQLAGDLAGTASAPTVPGLASKVSSVTAGDATITVGGTGTAPTIAVGTIPESKVTNLVSDLAAKANDAAVVHTTGNETIAGTKTFSSTIAGNISGNAATVTTNANLTGDVTSTGNSTTIPANSVTNAKAAQMPAGTIKGNNSGSTANASDLSGAQVTAMLSTVVGDTGTGGTKGLVPAPASGDASANKYLRADGSWATVASGGGSLSISDEGTSLTSAATSLNLVGKGVTGSTSGSAVTVTIPQAADWINVREYGAVGDGSTDDTTAINNAIAASLGGTYKRAVFFPAGNYKMTSGITVQSGLTMLGEGLSEKEFQKRSTITNTTTDTFVWGGSGATDSSQRPKDIIIRGLCFGGSNPNTNFLTPTASNASGAYPSHMVIEECGIHNYSTIISGSIQALFLKDCYLNNVSSSALNLSGSDSFIIRNLIDGYIAGSPSTAAMVVLNIEQSVFAENYVTCSPAIGIKVGNYSQGLQVVNNMVNGLAQTASHGGGNYADGPGIYVASGAGGVLISGNSIGNVCNNPTGNYDAAISVVDASNITITGNNIDTLRNVGGKHIRITQSSGTVNNVKVTGNNYTNGFSSNAIVSVAPIITVSGTTSNVFMDEWGSISKTVAGTPTDSSFLTPPPDGALATNTSTNTLYFRSSGTWNAVGGGGGGGSASINTMQYSVLSTSQAMTSSTTYVDSGLSFTATAGQSYMVQGQVVYDASTTGDLKLQFTVPSATSWYATVDGLVNGATGAGSSINRIMIGSTGPAGAAVGGVGLQSSLTYYTSVLITGWFQVTNSGTVKLQFAQSVSDTTATTLYPGSFINATRLA